VEYVLDTSVVIPILQDNEPGQYCTDNFQLASPETVVYISRVTVGELRAFAQRSWGDRRQADLEDWIANTLIIEINKPAVFDAYVELEIARHKPPTNGRTLGKNDLWIAATAVGANVELLTFDKGFDAMADVYHVQGYRIIVHDDRSISHRPLGTQS